jgi:hypothetical protein
MILKHPQTRFFYGGATWKVAIWIFFFQKAAKALSKAGMASKALRKTEKMGELCLQNLMALSSFSQQWQFWGKPVVFFPISR